MAYPTSNMAASANHCAIAYPNGVVSPEASENGMLSPNHAVELNYCSAVSKLDRLAAKLWGIPGGLVTI